MKPSPLLLLLLAITTTHAWLIPRDLPDGDYTITLHDPSNHANHTLTRHTLARHSPSRRDTWQSFPEAVLADADPANALPRPRPQGPPPRTNATDPPEVLPLPVSSYDCVFNAPRLPAADAAQSRRGLAAYCDRYLVPPRARHIQLSVTGAVAHYACSLTLDEPVKCTRRELDYAQARWWDMRCGPLRSGWVEMRGLGKVYGRGWVGMPICRKRNKKENKKMDDVYWTGVPGDKVDDGNQGEGGEEDDLEFPD